MTTTNIHLEPARHIRQAFIDSCRSGFSRNGFEERVRASLARDESIREQGSLLPNSVEAYALSAIEKNGTGIGSEAWQ